MIGLAAIVETGQLAKVVAYSLLTGVGISAVFGLGVSSAGGLLDAMREGRRSAAVLWGTLATLCLFATLAVIVLGIAILSTK